MFERNNDEPNLLFYYRQRINIHIHSIFHYCSTFNAFNKPDKECKTMEYP